MNNIITSIGIALSLLFVTNAHAQVPRLDKLLGVNKASSKASLNKTTTFKPTKSKLYNWTGSEWAHERDRQFIYKADGKIDEVINYYIYDSSKRKIVNLYNGKGEYSGYENYILTNGSWVLEYGQRENETYNSEGLLLKRIQEKYNGYPNILKWLPQHQYVYSYDAAGNLLTDLYQFNYEWDNGGVKFEDYGKYTYNYDQNGRKISKLHQRYDNGQWGDADKIEYSYKDDAIDQITYFYPSTMGLQPAERYINIIWHADNVRYLSYIRQTYFDSTWADLLKYNAVYDLSGGSVAIESRWVGSTWQNYRRWTQIINNRGDLISTVSEEYDFDAWKKMSGYEYSYTYSGDTMVEKITKEFNMYTQTFEYQYKEEYSNFVEVTDIFESGDPGNIQVYPNPAVDILYIDLGESHVFSSLQLYDINGRSIRSATITTNKLNLSTSDLKPGVYLLQLRGDKAVETRRIIKQ